MVGLKTGCGEADSWALGESGHLWGGAQMEYESGLQDNKLGR